MKNNTTFEFPTFLGFPQTNRIRCSIVRDGKNLIPGNLLKKSYFLKIHNISLKHSKGIFISEKTK